MCGISGIILKDETKPVSRHVLEQMVRALKHRGPDDQSIHINTCGFADHRTFISRPVIDDDDFKIVLLGMFSNKTQAEGDKILHLPVRYTDAYLGVVGTH